MCPRGLKWWANLPTLRLNVSNSDQCNALYCRHAEMKQPRTYFDIGH
ncbi:hypothetical protein [Methylomonas albis]|nr:hypothetical protein [Methylomonas albis]